jgi:PST family polysaccharide transporter
MTAWRRLLRASRVFLISNVAGAVLSFVLSILIGRAAGAYGLGVYSAVMAWVLPVSMAVDWGLSLLLTRELAASRDDPTDLFRHSIAFRLIAGALGMVGLWLTAPLLSRDPMVVMSLQMSAPMIVILPLYSSFTAVFKANDWYQPILWLNVGMIAAQILLTLAVLSRGMGIMGISAANVLSSAGQLAVAYWLWRGRFQQPRAPFALSSGRVRELVRRGYPFALAALFAAIQLRMSVMVLENTRGAADAGLFSAALRFTEAARLVPNAVFGAMLPVLAATVIHPANLHGLMRRTQLVLLSFGLLCAILFTLTAPWLLQTVYGDGFAEAAVALVVLAWALAISIQRGARTVYWFALGREHFVNRCNAAALGIQAALTIGLASAFGLTGVAAAVLAAEAAGLLLLSREWPLRLTRSNPSADTLLQQP